ncbi:MAG: bifunctional riboflavin kinase/FAD synthetase [Alphaproteobacteria bacterium]|nr:MAG: bifunctional riboflavin kinase/FAD synthetase [Alphaproteobacteria bacterium]
MRFFRHCHDLPAAARGGVVALGNFDGFHKGHQRVIAEAAEVADHLGVPLNVLTTEPHPRSYFNPDGPSFRLSTLRTKAHCLDVFGVDNFFVLSFDAALANMLAQDFVVEILVKGLEICHAVAGFDYRFGKGRGGGADVLRWMGLMEDFGVTIVEKVRFQGEGEAYSSSRIRNALRQGQVRTATDLLGHWWTVEGHVMTGDRRGRTIGFPTANLDMSDYLHPAFGVYAVRVELGGGDDRRVYDGVANIGRRPTFDKEDVTLEVFLFDFSGDLYGQVIVVEVVDFIRPERKFADVEALKAQIAADCETARKLLADPDLARERYALPRLERARS